MNLRRAAIRVFRSPRHCLAGAAILAAALLRFAPAYLAAQTPQISPAQAPSAATLDRCLASGAARTARGGRTGDIRFIGTAAGRPIPHPEPAAAAASPETAARAYLAVCGSLVGLADQASELAMTASLQADGARRIVRFRQHQDGIPIVGAELVVNLDATGNIVALSGETRRSSPLNIIPGIDAGGAAQTALDLVANVYAVDPARLVVSPPELWIYDPALIGPERGPARLVWRMNVTPTVLEPIRELVMVDAERGSVALHFNQVETARNRLTHTANNTNTLPGALVCGEANPTCAGADADAVAAHVYAGDTYNFYLTNHGRDSLNNAGMALVSTVHYGPADYQNAFWNGQQMAYGNGFSQGDDIVGHELTHGVTSFTSNLFYYYQSGAINESLSDVFGELIDLTNGTANDTPAVRWLLGEEIGAIRNMQNPPALGDPDRMTSPLYYPGPNDNGGVHTNSGINNKAASLMVDGGAFNGQSISALGIVKVAKIYYETQTHLLTSGADYADLFEALYQACNNLVGVGTTAGDCQQVRNATLAVEMHLQPGAGFNPEAPLCSPGQLPVTTFFDNLEAGPGNFTLSAAVGTQRWRYDDSFAHSGTRSLYADDLPAAVTDTSAALANNVAVPANAFLHFAHAFEFQGPSMDGGVLEYTTNGGASWTDAGALIDSNGYTGTIAAGSNPLAGRAAFVGASHGYISTRANLAPLAGQNVRFRWRMGLDASTFFWGWWLDDVRIYTCSGLGITSVTPKSSPQGFANLSVAVTGQSTHFVQGQTIASFGSGVIVHGTSVTDSTHASVHVSVPSGAAVGFRDVTLATGAEIAVGPSMFAVTPGATLTRVNPNRAQPGQQNLSVEISATLAHFLQGQTIASFGAGVTVASTRVIDANHVVAHLSVAPDAPLGPRTVMLTSGNELLTLENGFTVRRLPAQTQAFAYAVGRRLSPSQGGGPGSGTQTVTVVDTATNAVTALISAGIGCSCVGADGIAVAPDGASVYVTNEIENSLSVIDAVTNAVTATIPLGSGGPIAVAVSPDSTRVYVVMGAGTTAVKVIDTSTHAILSSIPLGVVQARGMAITPDGTRLYVSTYGTNSVKVVDTSALTVVATIPVGIQPLGVDASADGAFIYVSNMFAVAGQGVPGTVSIISTATNTLVGTVGVGLVPYSAKVSRDGNRAYVANASSSGVSVINAVTRTFAGTVAGSAFTNAIGFTPDSTRAYFATGSSIQVVNVAANAVMATINAPSVSHGFMLSMAMSPGATRGIALAGDLDFGTVPVGGRATRTLTITNTGNSPLAVSSLALPAGFSVSFAGASIAAAGSQQVAVTFAPTRAGSYGGTITAAGNQTLGRSTLGVSGYGSTDATRDTDFDRDTATDITVYRPSGGGWFVLRSGTAFTGGLGYSWGVSTDTPMPGDYDGDGKTDIAVFRPSTGHWFILTSSSNYTVSATYQWGTAGDRPVGGDFDGDGRSDLAVYRPSNGGWYVLLSSTGYVGGLGYVWGAAGDVPVPGDYDGDGRTDIAVYRGSTGHWFVLRSSSNYSTWATHQWGATGDVPVLGDYDGDNRRDLAVYRPSTGSWYILRSSSEFTAGAGYQWGVSTDVPVPGDYDGDGRTDIAVYRSSSGHWFILKSSSGYSAAATYQWGTAGDIPVVRQQ